MTVLPAGKPILRIRIDKPDFTFSLPKRWIYAKVSSADGGGWVLINRGKIVAAAFSSVFGELHGIKAVRKMEMLGECEVEIGELKKDIAELFVKMYPETIVSYANDSDLDELELECESVESEKQESKTFIATGRDRSLEVKLYIKDGEIIGAIAKDGDIEVKGNAALLYIDGLDFEYEEVEELEVPEDAKCEESENLLEALYSELDRL